MAKAKPTPATSEKLEPVSKLLLAWYDANRRRLPWRDEPSLYRTVVSEFMLQQTQIATVLPYFARWNERFPDFEALAVAGETDVLKLWEGLGYYSRARRLHGLAKSWVAAAEKPKTVSGWIEFSGIGPYTAAAIASIVFGEKAAVVDGNVVRVLSRLTNDRREFPDGARAQGMFAELAAQLIDHKRPGDYNQAVMELGATVCVKASPRCLLCPLRDLCAGCRAGDPGTLPRFKAKTYVEKEIERAILTDSAGRLLLHRAGADAIRLAGIAELPETGHLPEAWRSLPRRFLKAYKRSIVNERRVEKLWRFEPLPGERKEELPANLFWAGPAELARLTLAGPHRRWLGQVPWLET